MIKTLVKTLKAENSELFVIKGSQRLLLASCQVKLHVYEFSQKVTAIGTNGYQLKVNTSVVVECSDLETTRNVDADFLKDVSRFEVVTNIQRSDGVFERITFDNLHPFEIDLHGDWEFEVIEQYDLVKKLAAF